MNHELLALGFLILLAVAPIGWLVILSLRSHYGPVQSLFFAGAYLLTRVLWRTTAPRRLPLPPGQGAVVMSNHRSSVDPFFMQVAVDRPVHWMVAREYCEHFLFGPLLRVCEVIPVNRGGVDTAATKAAMRFTEQGGLVGMFPEGRINMTEQFMLPVRPGAVMVALRSRVPVLPCYIEGSPYTGTPWSPFLTPAKVRVQFGEPLDLSEYFDRSGEREVMEQVALMCVHAIAQLAGRDDFEPQLAGRKWKPTREELETAVAEHRRSAS